MTPDTTRIDGARFDRKGNVVADRRSYIRYGFSEYESGKPLRAPRRPSPARERFKAERTEWRAGRRYLSSS